jgi:hypothetical protein
MEDCLFCLKIRFKLTSDILFCFLLIIKGDVVVFELKDPNTLTLIVHIFRVKDYTFVRVANLGKAKHPDSSTVSTAPNMENFTSESRVRHTAESRKDNKSPGSNDRVEPKLPSPMAPQYAAVARYFANQGSPSVYGSQKACDEAAQEVQGQKANQAYDKGGNSSLKETFGRFLILIINSTIEYSFKKSSVQRHV